MTRRAIWLKFQGFLASLTIIILRCIDLKILSGFEGGSFRLQSLACIVICIMKIVRPFGNDIIFVGWLRQK